MRNENTRRPSREEIARMQELRKRMMGDPTHLQRMDRMEAVMQLGRPAYAFLDAPLPGEAAVRIIRDPGSPMPRLIIFSLPLIDEVSFALSQAMLMKSEIDEPEISGSITIDLLPGRTTLTTRTGADPVLKSIGGVSKPNVHQWQALEALKRLAAEYAPVALGDLGAARIIPAVPYREQSKWIRATGMLFFLPWIVTSPLWAFRFSPLRVPFQALSDRRQRKLDEEWRRSSKLAAALPATTPNRIRADGHFEVAFATARRPRPKKRNS